MKKAIITAFALLAMASCTNEDKAISILKKEGYTDIDITGYAPFMCGEEDLFSTGFTATNKVGERVSGAICGGGLKGYTIRFE